MAIIDTYRNNIIKKREEIAKLSADKAKQSDAISKARQKKQQAEDAIRRTKSQATIKSKMSDIQRAEKSITDANKKIAELDKKIAKAEKDLATEQKKYDREEMKIHERRIKDETAAQKKTEEQLKKIKNSMQEYENQQSDMMAEIESLKEVPSEIVVLFLASNPFAFEAPLRLDSEAREIQEMIRKTEYRDTIKFETRWAVRTSDILQVINEVDPDIIHFSGHGAENGDLMFESVAGDVKLVSKEAMAQTISTLTNKVKFMFFNACFSSAQAEHLVSIVDAAIGMNTEIGDEAAKVFAAQFYSSIGFGKSVKVAFEQARASLMLEGISEENTPELYVKDGMDSDEIVLVMPD